MRVLSSMSRVRATMLIAALAIAGAGVRGDVRAQTAQGGDRPPASLSASTDEIALYALYKENKLITARAKAQALLDESPGSILGNFVMGAVLREAEGDLGRAMAHMATARRLFEEKYGAFPGEGAPWQLHRELLIETQILAGELEEYEFQLQILDFYDALYAPRMVAERAWPLLRLGRFEEARVAARKGIGSADPGQQSVGRNAMCALEGEARTREPYFKACLEALEGAKQRAADEARVASKAGASAASPSGPVVHGYNAALSAYAVLRYEEVERLARDAARSKAFTIANPWRLLARLYTDAGRGPEAIAAAREMQSWRARQPASLRDQDRAETDVALSTLLLVAGDSGGALRLAERAIQRPDRRGLVSSKPDQALGAHALLRRAAERMATEQARERASYSGTRARIEAAIAARGARVASFPDDARIVSILAADTRLDSTFRIHLGGGIEPVPVWMLGDLIEMVGPGVVAVALGEVRKKEKLPGLVPYYDALEAEVALAWGDESRCIELAERSLGTLPKSEALLEARIAAIAGEAARRKGDLGRALQLFERAFGRDPGVIRRLGLSVPAVIKSEGGDLAITTAADLLSRSPRLRVGGGGFVITVRKGPRGLEACMRSPEGAEISCSRAEQGEKQSAYDWGARVVELFHRDAFAIRLGLTTADLNSLDGSTTIASQAQREQLKGLLDDLARDAPE